MKVSDLTGADLVYWSARASGYNDIAIIMNDVHCFVGITGERLERFLPKGNENEQRARIAQKFGADVPDREANKPATTSARE
jgi:hypothetical protein